MNKWQANARQAYWRETESQAVQNKFKPEKKLNYNRYTADGWWKFLNGCNQMMQGLSQAAPLRQSCTAIGIVPLKYGQGDNLSPSKFREKTRKEAHTKRFISVQKLQAETERGKYILSHL